jgi:hypothetical protein
MARTGAGLLRSRRVVSIDSDSGTSAMPTTPSRWSHPIAELPPRMRTSSLMLRFGPL